MALFGDPETHRDNPPSTWQVVKASERRWELRAAAVEGVMQSFTTRRQAQEAREAGFFVDLYEKEGRWYAGLPVPGWKPYAATA